MNKHIIARMVLATVLAGCTATEKLATTGSIERLDPALDAVVSTDAKIEILGRGYTWSEGPVWVDDHKMLLFSDVPQDTVYKWTEAAGVQVYLTPSGYTGTGPSDSPERGSNGLVLDPTGRLVLCQHGDRRVAVMDAPLDHPAPKFLTIADKHNGRRFDSPNDAVYDAAGNLYMTDPPYGLKGHEQNPTKEIPSQGVYKVLPNGEVIVLVDTLTKPNGIALSPDQKSLFVANSDPAKARWYKFGLGDTAIVSGKIFYDITSVAQKEQRGVPDGMKVNSHGIVFASGPSGIWIFREDGKPIGRIKLGDPTANCALTKDEKTLFITSKDKLLRVALK